MPYELSHCIASKTVDFMDSLFDHSSELDYNEWLSDCDDDCF